MKNLVVVNMPKISDIEFIIRELIRVNEKIVTTYDSKLLCSDYENTKNQLKQLLDEKTNLMSKLESSLNEFFEIKENIITKKIKVNSFKLIPSLINFEYKFNVPRSVNETSRQYFCYICLMEKLSKEYDIITLKHDGYHMLDITANLNLKKLLGDKNVEDKSQ